MNTDGSGRSDVSELNTEEVIRQMRAKTDVVKARRDAAEIEALGEYNGFSRPRCSQVSSRIWINCS